MTLLLIILVTLIIFTSGGILGWILKGIGAIFSFLYEGFSLLLTFILRFIVYIIVFFFIILMLTML